MDERDLDRAIDTAAEAMMASEPSRLLDYNVMARVREDVAPAAERRFVWITATASALMLGGVVMLVTMNRAPAPATEGPTRAPQESRVISPSTAPPVVEDERQSALPPVARPRMVKVAAQPSPSLARELESAIEPLAPEPIVLSDIQPAPLPVQVTSIANIDIADLTIEPLATSND